MEASCLVDIDVIFRQAELGQDFGNGCNGANAHVPWFDTLGVCSGCDGNGDRLQDNIPMTVHPTHLAKISMPSACALSLVERMHSAAPSPMPLALPAVVVSPQSGNTGFKPARDSTVTPGRMVSSTEMTDSRTLIGMISSANIPFSRAYPGSTKKNQPASIRCDRYLAGSGVRNERILVLLSARDLVRLCDHFSGPSHRLELCNLNMSKGGKLPSHT